MSFEKQIEIEANQYTHPEQRIAFVKGAMRGFSLAMGQINLMFHEIDKRRTTQTIIVKDKEELLKSL